MGSPLAALFPVSGPRLAGKTGVLLTGHTMPPGSPGHVAGEQRARVGDRWSRLPRAPTPPKYYAKRRGSRRRQRDCCSCSGGTGSRGFPITRDGIQLSCGSLGFRLRACLRSLFQSRAREEAVGSRVRKPLPHGRGSVRPTLLKHPLRAACREGALLCGSVAHQSLRRR